MSDGDRAAVDVETVFGNGELATNSNCLRGECFVQLEEIDVAEFHARLLQRGSHRGHGSHPHDSRGNAGTRVAANPSQGNAILGFRARRAHDHDGGSAVIDTARISGGDRAVLRECGAQRGEAFGGGSGTGMLVGVDQDRLLLPLHGDRDNLVLEAAAR